MTPSTYYAVAAECTKLPPGVGCPDTCVPYLCNVCVGVPGSGWVGLSFARLSSEIYLKVASCRFFILSDHRKNSVICSLFFSVL